jgi:transketolase
MSLRLIPNLNVYRPADVIETAECWALSLETTHSPSVLALSRQNLPQLRGAGDESWNRATNRSAKGAYRLVAASGPRKVVLMASGSEVAIAAEVAKALETQGIGADVVSVPCWELFDAQEVAYRAELLPADVLKVSIEAGVTAGWQKYVGDGLTIGIDSFGASAPADVLYDHFGLTVEKILPRIVARLS